MAGAGEGRPEMGRQASPSPCSRRGGRSWRAALLAASMLNSCFLLTQSQDISWATEIPVTWKPLRPFKGQNLTLTPGGSPDFLYCNWYHGGRMDKGKWIFMYLPRHEQQNGPAHTGRETGGLNCSLHIRRLKLEDAGNYTVYKAISGASSEIGVVHVIVLGPRKLERGMVAGIAIGALCMAVIIGVLIHCVFCGCCCFRGGGPRGRIPQHPYFGQRRHTV